MFLKVISSAFNYVKEESERLQVKVEREQAKVDDMKHKMRHDLQRRSDRELLHGLVKKHDKHQKAAIYQTLKDRGLSSEEIKEQATQIKNYMNTQK